MILWLTILSVGISVAIPTLGALILLDARRDVWRQAEQASANLALALEHEVGRNIATLDLSLQGAADALRQPGINQVSPDIRHMALFDRAATAEFMGALLIINADGKIVADSTSLTPHDVYLGDRDYFRIHQEQADVGLYISNPYISRLEPGEPRIAVSYRLASSDGVFEGVVMGALRLAYFQHLFGKLDLGSKGIAAVLRSDGQVIARYPFRPTDIGLNIANSENFRHVSAKPSGTFVAAAAIDGIRRLYTFRHVEGLPLVLSVGLEVNEIYAAWWRKAMIIGSLLTVLCSAMMGLCLLFRREVLRRMAAEHALVEMATTDGLTALANRRSFDLTLHREWKRAIRDQTSVTLLMLDVDCFKLYNDNYGHQDGDAVLQRVAKCIKLIVRRPADFVARYGGEEFVALLPMTELIGALTVAECIRGAVEQLAIPHIGCPGGRVTVSIGLAARYPQIDDHEAVLLKEADTALYNAKRSGRNRVSYAGNCTTAILATSP